MPKPVTPMVAADVFVLNAEGKVLLVRRADNGFWAMPGGCQDLGETPAQCAVRECFEESGYRVRVTRLIGVYSSQCYEYVHYPWKENEFTHIFFRGELEGGTPTLSEETTEIGWFAKDALPPLSDGHELRIAHGFESAENSSGWAPYFE